MRYMARGKKGQVLLLALMIMFVGAVILTGLFQYLGTSLLLATKGEENAVNYYAADSGIEDAVYWLQNGQEDQEWWDCDEDKEQCEREGYTLNYTNSGLNNRTVNVSVVNNPEGLGNTTYKITSTATHNKSGVSTIIESHIRATPIKFWEFGKDAITSNCSVTVQSGVDPMINGSVTYVCDDGLTCLGSEDCNIMPPYEATRNSSGIGWWPETWAITQYFEDEAENQGAVHMAGPVAIDVASNPSLGPLYVDGDLNIYSSQKNPVVSASLDGIVYVTGTLTIGANIGVDRDFILDLNNQVIFVENKGAIIGGDQYTQSKAEVVITEYCTFTGSGAIFAIGDIYFAPKMSTSAEDFMFVMSLEGWIQMHPSGNFFGSLAGNIHVDVSPSNRITRTEGGDFWNTFFDPEPIISKIITYDIIDR